MRTEALIINGYDIRCMVQSYIGHHPEVKNSADLERLEDLYFDYTQACDLNECRAWLRHFIQEGLQDLEKAAGMYMPEQRNSRAQLEYEGYLKIIAAYNLLGEDK